MKYQQSYQRFYPDIESKYHNICAYMNEKNKTVEEFNKILKDFCDWELYNSKNLDKFANSVSKLLLGKDPLKDVFILFERILASKSESSQKIAVNIKEDMLPFLENAINTRNQSALKEKEESIKEVRLKMQNKTKKLYYSEINYREAHEMLRQLNASSGTTQSREAIERKNKLKNDLISTEEELSEKINLYNHSVEEYLFSYTKLCEEFSEIETQRKDIIKESISKYIVFEMDGIKNIEYDMTKHAQTISKMDTKLLIQDKPTNDHRAIPLAKISSLSNYMAHIAEGESKQQNGINDSFNGNVVHNQYQREMNSLKMALAVPTDPSASFSYELSSDKFEELMFDINSMLNEARELNDMRTVKEIVLYAKDYFMMVRLPERAKIIHEEDNDAKQENQRAKTFEEEEEEFCELERARTASLKVPLLNGILCHPIFSDQGFWDKYNKRLSEIVQTELSESSSLGFQQSRTPTDEMKISLSFLSADIEFMKSISSAQCVNSILNNFLKYNLGSSENVIKSSDNVNKSKENLASSASSSVLQTTSAQKQLEEDYSDCEQYF